MSLACPTCRAPFQAKDVRLDLALATCHACGAVHDLSGRKGLESPGALAKKLSPRPRVGLPRRFQVDTTDSSTRISWRWFGPKYLFTAAFCVFWDCFLVFWYTKALGSARTPLPMIFFPLIHVGVGVGLTYYTLAGFLNRTRIDVDRERVRVQLGPLPWKGSLELPSQQLKQLYVEESVKLHRGTQTVTYNLMALDQVGAKVKLVSGLDEKDHALYLEQELEHQLGIEDAPVRGAIEA